MKKEWIIIMVIFFFDKLIFIQTWSSPLGLPLNPLLLNRNLW